MDPIIAPPAPLTPPPAFAGFDTSGYPGDQHMSTWKESSPYLFAGYYLKAPCHKSSSWMGRRAALDSMGWHLLPVYVGQQVAGVSPCTSSVLSASQGETDATDAGSKMASEGFDAGLFVYLEWERTDIFPTSSGRSVATQPGSTSIAANPPMSVSPLRISGNVPLPSIEPLAESQSISTKI